jgi:hypothetical protein
MNRAVHAGLAAAGVVILAACGANNGEDGGDNTPTGPAETRVIRLEGDLSFGDLPVGSTLERELRIHNSGNAPLTVSGVSGATGYALSWMNGTIAAGASQLSVVRFTPVAEQSYTGTITVRANHTSGTNTIAVSGRGIDNGARAEFGNGRHLVHSDIRAGRYYSDPAFGCRWERLSGLGGTFADIIATEFIAFNASQWIVDILPTDRAFQTGRECGTWFNTPRHGAQSDIGTGVWLVPQQVVSGMYRADARAGCYWERVRNFEGGVSSIIANQFVTSTGSRQIEIGFLDAGFHSAEACGTWTRVQGVTVPAASAPRQQNREDIEHQRELYRRHYGR